MCARQNTHARAALCSPSSRRARRRDSALSTVGRAPPTSTANAPPLPFFVVGRSFRGFGARSNLFEASNARIVLFYTAPAARSARESASRAFAPRTRSGGALPYLSPPCQPDVRPLVKRRPRPQAGSGNARAAPTLLSPWRPHGRRPIEPARHLAPARDAQNVRGVFAPAAPHEARDAQNVRGGFAPAALRDAGDLDVGLSPSPWGRAGRAATSQRSPRRARRRWQSTGGWLGPSGP